MATLANLYRQKLPTIFSTEINLDPELYKEEIKDANTYYPQPQQMQKQYLNFVIANIIANNDSFKKFKSRQDALKFVNDFKEKMSVATGQSMVEGASLFPQNPIEESIQKEQIQNVAAMQKIASQIPENSQVKQTVTQTIKKAKKRISRKEQLKRFKKNAKKPNQVMRVMVDQAAIKDLAQEQYKVDLKQLVDAAQQKNLSKQIVKKIGKIQQYLLDNQKLQSSLQNYYTPVGSFNRLANKRNRNLKQVNNYVYPKKNPYQFQPSFRRYQDANQYSLDQQLHLLPKYAPSFVSKVIGDVNQKVETYIAHQDAFNPLKKFADQAGMTIGDIVVNRQYWQKNKPPPGFQWDQDRQQIVLSSQNKYISSLYPGGIGYKYVPSANQIKKKYNFLQQSYKTAKQSQQARDRDLIALLDGAKALGFNPHFGAISKNSPAIYVGAFIDPLTGNIRLPGKPKTKDFNPVDRQSMLQYKVLRAIYTWNSNMRNLQQLRSFMDQTQKGWKATVKGKKKQSNVIQRRRNQYRSLARKLALKQPIYGYTPNDQLYEDLQKVWGNENATRQQLEQAANGFFRNVALHYSDEVKRQAQKFPDQKISLGDMARAKYSNTFQQRAVDGAANFLNRTLIKSVPVGQMNTRVQQQSIYGPAARQMFNKQRMGVKKYSSAFNTLSNLRKSKQHNRYNLANQFFTAVNPVWDNYLYKRDNDEIDPNVRIKDLKRSFRTLDFDQDKVRPRIDRRYEVLSSKNYTGAQANLQRGYKDLRKIYEIINQEKITDNQISQTLKNYDPTLYSRLQAMFNNKKYDQNLMEKAQINSKLLKDAFNLGGDNFKNSAFAKALYVTLENILFRQQVGQQKVTRQQRLREMGIPPKRYFDEQNQYIGRQGPNYQQAIASQKQKQRKAAEQRRALEQQLATIQQKLSNVSKMEDQR